MVRFILKAVALFFAICLLISVVQGIRNPLPQKPASKATPEEEALGRDISTRAYAVGKTMSKAGAIKPTSDKVDAMSRRMQAEMGVTGPHSWFKQHFETGFWQGWKAR